MFQRPTLTELRQRSAADFSARLPGADSRLRHSNIRVSSEVMAGLTHLAYGRLEWVVQQTIPDTANAQFLERWCTIFGLARKGAVRASGTIRFTGQDGAEIALGSEVQSGAVNGVRVLYRTTDDAIIAGGEAIVPAEAVSPGAAGNLDDGVTVTLIAALPAIVAQATLQSAMTGGADEEPDEELRARLLFELQKPPHGGNANDYIRWALEVPGVTRAWVSPLEFGAGTVVVRFMMDRVRADDDGFPQGDGWPTYTDDLAEVADHIAPLRPVTANVFVVAPVPHPINVTVKGLTPDTPETRLAVELELRDLLLRSAAPGLTIPRSWLWAAIASASGEYRHEVLVPAADVTVSIGDLATLGTLTFTA
jgi:uncharacterized phage protein gp47/JayE